MVGKILNLLPFHLKKHYINPVICRIKDKGTYHREYSAPNFFDKFHSLSDANNDDRATISPDFPNLDAKYHYNAVENKIMAFIKKHNIDTNMVLDIGSGTGHWVDFYYSFLNSSKVYGTDISEVAVRKLTERFKVNDSINILRADFENHEFLREENFSIINAIGIMFHIVSDKKWEETIRWCYNKLIPGGVFIASGLFGVITANVQFEPVDFSTIQEYREGSELACNKRVRSRHYWKKILKKNGFRKIMFERTKIPSHIHSPENNLVYAIK